METIFKLMFICVMLMCICDAKSQGTSLINKACLNNCIDSCDAGSTTQHTGSFMGVQGPPGKRGHPGIGGPIGVQGNKGEPGECECQLEEEVQQLKKELKKLQLVTCRHLSKKLGMKSGEIEDDDITASSEYNDDHGARHGRLDGTSGIGAWCASEKRAGDWLQVSFAQPTYINGVITQGYVSDHYTKTFNVKYQQENGTWMEIMNEDGSVKVFTGNHDANTWKENIFPEVLLTRAVRVVVQTWSNHPCLRIELLGC